MGVALVAAKGVHFPLPEFSIRNMQVWSQNALVASGADAMYALVVGLLGQGLLWASRRRPRIHTSIWIVLLVYCFLSVLFAIASVYIFDFMRMPLTYALLYVAGDLGNMRSSVAVFLKPGLVAALVAMPVLYLALVIASDRFTRFPRNRWVRAGQGMALALVALWFGYARYYAHGSWASRHSDRRIADNPHYVLLASFVAEVFGSPTVTLKEQFPPEFQDDFLVVAERPNGAPLTAGLRRGPKNVILLVMESVGTQHLSLYGSPYPTTPRLQAESTHALVFDNFYSHITNTANSLAALTLSIYPTMTWREYTVERPRVPGTTVAQVLKPAGYRTAFISAGDNEFSNQLAFLKDRGFDAIWDYRDSGHNVSDDFSWGVEDRYMVDMVLRYIDQDPAKPFYIMSWTQGTHHPYTSYLPQDEIDFFKGMAPKPHDDWDLGHYLNALHEADKQIGRLFDELRRRGLADDTIVLVTGDHGEAFGVPHASYGHSGKVYQEDVHVPLTIWSPSLYSDLPRAATVGAHVDLAPTILDLLGIAAPATWQGHSLFAPARPPRAYFYGAMDNYLFGVREGNYKYVFNATLGQEELYDLTSDPQEVANVSPQAPDVSHRLRQYLAAWLDYQKHHAP